MGTNKKETKKADYEEKWLMMMIFSAQLYNWCETDLSGHLFFVWLNYDTFWLISKYSNQNLMLKNLLMLQKNSLMRNFWVCSVEAGIGVHFLWF